MIRIAVCDDDPLYVKEIENLLRLCEKKYNIKVDVSVFLQGKKLEESMMQKKVYDAIFLDIQMDGQDGILTAKNIRKIDEKVLLVYVSAHESFIEEIFEVTPFRFIKKPINSQRFHAVFELIYQKMSDEQKYFTYMYKKEFKRIEMDQILYFESRGRKINIHLQDGRELYLYGKLDELEQTLKERKINFLRIHQSFLVRYSAIANKKYTEMNLINGQCLTISRGKQKSIEEEYCRLMGGEIVG